MFFLIQTLFIFIITNLKKMKLKSCKSWWHHVQLRALMGLPCASACAPHSSSISDALTTKVNININIVNTWVKLNYIIICWPLSRSAYWKIRDMFLIKRLLLLMNEPPQHVTFSKYHISLKGCYAFVRLDPEILV